MKPALLTFLTRKKDEKKLSYEDMAEKANMSKSKLQRIFTNQADPTISDLEDIVEKALGASMRELYAIIGEQELVDSEELGYKGAKELMADFAAEKKQIRAEYQTRIDQLVTTSDERQKAFTIALEQIGEQYKANAAYLKGVIIDNEQYIRDLIAQTERANVIAADAQKQASEAEKRADAAEAERSSAELENRTTRKKMYKLFSGMLAILIAVFAFLMFIIIADVPYLGGGNLPR